MYKRKSVNIPNYEMYECDTEGIVYGRNKQPLKPSTNPRGYKIINFCLNGKAKGFSVHHVIAVTFLPNSENKPTVNHKDGNTQNNKADNLEWATHREQAYHSMYILGNSKMGKLNINARAIQGFDKKNNMQKYSFDSLADAARFFVEPNKEYRYVQNCIYKVLSDKYPDRKSYKGCVWKYVEDVC